MRAVLLFVVLLMPVLASVPKSAWASDELYAVQNVHVDVTAETAAAARDKALFDGQRRALREVLSRLTLSADLPLLPDPPDQQISEMLRGFSVIAEKNSTVRYVADLNYQFKPRAVRELLVQSGLFYAETKSRPVLIVPVFVVGGFAYLWEEPNPWREAWANLDETKGLLPILTPFGDVADIADLNTQAAINGDLDRIQVMAERYGARRGVVATASSSIDPETNGPVLEISVLGRTSTGEDQTIIESIYGAVDINAALAEGVQRIVVRLTDDWKRANTVRSGVEARMTVVVPIEDFQYWQDIKAKLKDMPIVRRQDLIKLSKTQAMLDLWVQGDSNQLSLALDQRELKLVPAEPDWLLVGRSWQPEPVQLPEPPVVQPETPKQPVTQ